MLISKKLTSVVTTSFCLISMFLVSNAQAGLITMSPETLTNVSINGTSAEVISTKNTLENADILVRERESNSPQLRIASFIQFDLSSLTATIVNSSNFSAIFYADLVDTLNSSNALEIMIGQVVDGNSWSSSTDPLFSWANNSINESTFVDNVNGLALGSQDLDVTNIVRGWVNGTSENNGFVVYGAERAYQGAGFDNARLQVEVPEPSTIAIFALGIIGLASRRFKKQS
jgi:hypothetical protein